MHEHESKSERLDAVVSGYFGKNTEGCGPGFVEMLLGRQKRRIREMSKISGIDFHRTVVLMKQAVEPSLIARNKGEAAAKMEEDLANNPEKYTEKEKRFRKLIFNRYWDQREKLQ
jgi:hypothetical protein